MVTVTLKRRKLESFNITSMTKTYYVDKKSLMMPYLFGGDVRSGDADLFRGRDQTTGTEDCAQLL